MYSFVQYRTIQRDIEAGFVRTYDRFDTLWVIGLVVAGTAMCFHLFTIWRS